MPKHSLHIFRAGRQKTAAGDEIEFSAADLANCAKAYNPQLHRAPIVVGHPKTDAPAYGVIKSLQVVNGDLVAEPESVEPQFAELVRQKRFIAVSSAFYRPTDAANPTPGSWYLRHVGFLGAEPPALKGLRPPEFAEVDDEFVTFAEATFSDPAITSVSDLLSNLREWLISRFSADDADKVLPRWQIDSIRSMGEERPYVPAEGEMADTVFKEAPAGAAITTTTQESEVTTAQITQLQAELAAANAATAAEKARADGLAASTAASVAAARAASAAEFAEGLVAADKLLPKDKGIVEAVLCAVEVQAQVEFGEGEAKKPLGAALRELLSALPKHALNGEHIATNSGAANVATDTEAVFSEGQKVDPDSLVIHRKAEALAKEKGIPYIDAVRQVTGR